MNEKKVKMQKVTKKYFGGIFWHYFLKKKKIEKTQPNMFMPFLIIKGQNIINFNYLPTCLDSY